MSVEGCDRRLGQCWERRLTYERARRFDVPSYPVPLTTCSHPPLGRKRSERRWRIERTCHSEEPDLDAWRQERHSDLDVFHHEALFEPQVEAGILDGFE